MTQPVRSSDNSIRVALVTGANRGIGLEVCRQLAEREFVVLLTARGAATANSAAKRLGEVGKVEPLALDVANTSSIKKAAADAPTPVAAPRPADAKPIVLIANVSNGGTVSASPTAMAAITIPLFRYCGPSVRTGALPLASINTHMYVLYSNFANSCMKILLHLGALAALRPGAC